MALCDHRWRTHAPEHTCTLFTGKHAAVQQPAGSAQVTGDAAYEIQQLQLLMYITSHDWSLPQESGT